MLDFAGLKADVRSLSPTQISATAAGKAINAVYQSLLTSRPGGGTWFGLKQSWTLTTLPDTTGGTITVTQGSTIVTGVGTAFAATDALRFLKVGDRVPLRVASIASPTQLTLQQEWGEPTLADTPYTIMSLRYLLPSDADVVDKLVGDQWPLRRHNFGQVDVWDPGRNVRGIPLVYQEMELLSAAAALINQPSVLSGTVPMPTGGTTATVLISAGTSAYEVNITPSWFAAPTVRAGSKQATQFIVDFSVPAPAGGTFDWTVIIQGQSSGLSLVETTKEIELWPVPNQYGTLTLGYKKRVDDLINDRDVPVLNSDLIRWAARAEICNALAARTGDSTWTQREQVNQQRAAALLQATWKEDRKQRGALKGWLDSEDVGAIQSMAWLQAWRVLFARYGG